MQRFVIAVAVGVLAFHGTANAQYMYRRGTTYSTPGVGYHAGPAGSAPAARSAIAPYTSPVTGLGAGIYSFPPGFSGGPALPSGYAAAGSLSYVTPIVPQPTGFGSVVPPTGINTWGTRYTIGGAYRSPAPVYNTSTMSVVPSANVNGLRYNPQLGGSFNQSFSAGTFGRPALVTTGGASTTSGYAISPSSRPWANVSGGSGR